MENREKSPKKQKIKLNTKSQHAAYFMPMLEGFAQRDMLNEVIKNRVVKACDLLDAGVPLFPNDFRKGTCRQLGAGQFRQPERRRAGGQGGRVRHRRPHRLAALLRQGGLFPPHGRSGRIQCYASREELPADVYNVVKKLDVGDIVGVSGHLSTPRRAS